jgi:hypothetical protein
MKQLIRRILKEETKGIDIFIDKIDESFNLSDELKTFLENFINNSECKNIEFHSFNYQIGGIALSTGVVINDFYLKKNLELLLYVIFHEIAHQYQYKKYGADVMYSIYVGDIDINEGVKILRKTEEIADDFSHRKIRELQKKDLIDKSYEPPRTYEKVSNFVLSHLINGMKNNLKSKGIKDSEEISKYLYNMVKNDTLNF